MPSLPTLIVLSVREEVPLEVIVESALRVIEASELLLFWNFRFPLLRVIEAIVPAIRSSLLVLVISLSVKALLDPLLLTVILLFKNSSLFISTLVFPVAWIS